jgi:hypothetical protein
MNATFDSMMNAMGFKQVSPDRHVESVREMLLSRSVVGLKKYGVTTERDDLSKLDWLKNAQEEALDLAVYLETLIQLEKKE